MLLLKFVWRVVSGGRRCGILDAEEGLVVASCWLLVRWVGKARRVASEGTLARERSHVPL